MDARAWRWGLSIVGLVALSAGAAGLAVMHALGGVPPTGFVPLFATALLVPPMLGLQMARHGVPGGVVVGALGSAAWMAAFFGAPILGHVLLEGPSRFDPAALLLVFGLLPVFMGALGGAGTAFLVRGMLRYREEHGLVHAPR